MIPSALLGKVERSAESVTPGHPDKICDQIADSFVDAVLPFGPDCRMAAEVTGGHKVIFVTGEAKMPDEKGLVAIDERRIREIYREITGGNELKSVLLHMEAQSLEIAQGVDTGGAGDQGVMVGYATDETPEMLPLPFLYARRLTRTMYEAAHGKIPGIFWMRPDGKSEVVMVGEKVISLIIAVQHHEISRDQMIDDLVNEIIMPQIGQLPDDLTKFVVNGTGIFMKGDFEADAGTTGRKLVVDNYGPEVPIGGGAYSGKDPTKVDRSAAYMARHVAKNIVAHQIGGAHRAHVLLAYVIGQAEPLGVQAITDTGEDVSQWVRAHFDLRPRAIIECLNLWRPIYRQVCARGHYGIDHNNAASQELLDTWTWERVRDDL